LYLLCITDQQEEQVSLGNLRRFSFKELQIATNNFSSKNILGKGGFGNVYKGELRDGTLVAVPIINFLLYLLCEVFEFFLSVLLEVKLANCALVSSTSVARVSRKTRISSSI
jgi:hypothetical protein